MVKVSLIVLLIQIGYYRTLGAYTEVKLDNVMTLGWDIDEQSQEISMTVTVSSI